MAINYYKYKKLYIMNSVVGLKDFNSHCRLVLIIELFTRSKIRRFVIDNTCGHRIFTDFHDSRTKNLFL